MQERLELADGPLLALGVDAQGARLAVAYPALDPELSRLDDDRDTEVCALHLAAQERADRLGARRASRHCRGSARRPGRDGPRQRGTVDDQVDSLVEEGQPPRDLSGLAHWLWVAPDDVV